MTVTVWVQVEQTKAPHSAECVGGKVGSRVENGSLIHPCSSRDLKKECIGRHEWEEDVSGYGRSWDENMVGKAA